jgi:hypothetical protein
MNQGFNEKTVVRKSRETVPLSTSLSCDGELDITSHYVAKRGKIGRKRVQNAVYFSKTTAHHDSALSEENISLRGSKSLTYDKKITDQKSKKMLAVLRPSDELQKSNFNQH